MKTRESGLDLIRCLAFLLVVVFHSFLNNGGSLILGVLLDRTVNGLLRPGKGAAV